MHGGGLVMYASTFHFGLAYEMYKVATASGDDVALAVLAYGESSGYLHISIGFLTVLDTCPSAPYPTQLRQLVAFVTHLMHGRDSKDVSRYPSHSRLYANVFDICRLTCTEIVPVDC